MKPGTGVSFVLMGQFFHSFSQILLVFSVFPVTVCRSGKTYQSASFPFALPKGGYHILNSGFLRFGG
jgi:hypothetical protein